MLGWAPVFLPLTRFRSASIFAAERVRDLVTGFGTSYEAAVTQVSGWSFVTIAAIS